MPIGTQATRVHYCYPYLKARDPKLPRHEKFTFGYTMKSCFMKAFGRLGFIAHIATLL